ncbi:gamma-glutamyl-gamma-aminobutyrate hydrolase family protein [Celeribacter litoreus]|uniref:gamma-glutamyl-gamma-aminobutyrate hydrolase family protein n=1 Tax=Celeribacter litoreus TaxID=2876714 RepID=UPI001CCC1C2A|nr:gamma-glutamyl-gamma-aminobutyrate hydrolase family protein [Celeribacter litoreus]MCA0041894.1 gamma-glutamyl-gamma-aminobutyrate hydrolase family protein [Celeribacter litoreus]
MSDHPKPVIGVTTSKRSGWRIFPLVALNIWLAGGRAVRFGTGRENDLDAVDGLIIGGGDDISPDLYHGEVVASVRLDPVRDALEEDLVHEAFKRNMPVMGICRGAQMINVALGGTLYQDAYGTYVKSQHVRTVLPKKTVCPEADTRLSEITGPEEMVVNALHSQAVDKLGEGLRVAARDPGGMVQAIERINDPFAIGVQWHPEHLFYAHRQRALFRAIVTAASAYQASGHQISKVAEHARA